MASKNVILKDKAGNQLAPATTAEQVRYDSTSNVKQAISRASGHATTANTAADMTDTTRIYVYTGSESGYTAGNWYYYDGSVWISGGQYTDGVQFETDTTLSLSGKAADAKKVGDELTDIEERVEALEHGSGSGGGVPTVVRQALLTLLKSTVYGDTGLTDEMAVIESWVSDVDLTSLSAVYSGGPVRTGTNLNALKTDLTVTAAYSDGSSATVTDYTLSGTLMEGTSTITVSHGGMTTTFTVTVVSGTTLLNSWDFTESMVDSVGGKTATTTASQDATGLHFTAGQKYAEFPTVYAKDRTYEIDVTSILRSGTNLTVNYGRLFMIDADSVTGTGGSGYLLTATKKGGDLFYMNGAWESNVIVDSTTDPNGSFYDNSTVGFYIDPSGYVHVYKNGTLLGVSTGALAASYDGASIYIGSSSNQDALQNSTFTAFRVYDGNKYGGEG